MRHRMRGRRLGRSTSHRRALGRNLVSSLFLHGRVITTAPKAKEYKAMAEKLITLSKRKDLHRVRRAARVLNSKAAVAALFDSIGPAMADRPGGYTRILRLAKPRLGDQGQRVLWELVTFVPQPAQAAEDSATASASR